MKIYLAGPMRGYANFNFPAFDYAAGLLREEGHEVFSPADNDREKYGLDPADFPTGNEDNLPPGVTVRLLLGDDVRWICEHADAIALLRGWERSNGASAELAVAKALGLTVITLGNDYHE